LHSSELAVLVLFFAVEHGSLDMIRILVEAGADVEACTFQWQIPVLAYVVLLSDVDKKDTAEVLKLLLALSAHSDSRRDMEIKPPRCSKIPCHHDIQ
jgi:hypothetical protein